MAGEERLDRRIDSLGERINTRLDEHFAKLLEWQGERAQEIADIQASLESHLGNHHGLLSKAKIGLATTAMASVALVLVEVIKQLA